MNKPVLPVFQPKHPLAFGISSYFLLNELGPRIYDPLARNIGTEAGGDVLWSADVLGRTPRFPGNGYYALSKMLGPTSTPMSFVMGIKPTSLAAENGLFKTVTSTQYSGVWGYLVASTGYFAITVGEGAGAGSRERRTTRTTKGIPNNKSVHIAAVVNTHSSHTIYFDGIQQGVTTDGTGGSFGTATTGGQLGRYSDANNTKYLTGLMYYFYVYNRIITAAEVRALALDPYAMFRSPKLINLSALASSTTTIRLTWQDNSEGEESFSIERDTDGGGFVEINTTAAGAETYDDSPDIGHTYTYRVRAISDALGDSEYSNEAEVIV